MMDERGDRGTGGSGSASGGGSGRFFHRRRVCRLCYEKNPIEYNDLAFLRNYLTERGRIKRARTIAILAFAEER